MIKQADYVMEWNDAGHRCRWCEKILRMNAITIEEKWEIHHWYWKSQYNGDDRDDSRNLFLLCVDCHRWDNWVHNWNKHLDRMLKRIADQRKPPEERSEKKVKRQKYFRTEREKERARKISRENRKNQITRFQEQHEWRTPSQVQYSNNKEYRASQKE